MQARNDVLPLPMLISAFLSRYPGERFTLDQIVVALDHDSPGLAQQGLRTQVLRGVISAEKRSNSSKRLRYFTTAEQAETIQAELLTIARSAVRWLKSSEPADW